MRRTEQDEDIASTNNTPHSTSDNLLPLLDEQLDLFEAYVNIQTLYDNITSGESCGDKWSVIESHMEITRSVQSFWKKLEEQIRTNGASHHNGRSFLWEDHMELTRRVLKTIHRPRSSLPLLPKQNNNLVALAVLRASIEEIKLRHHSETF